MKRIGSCASLPDIARSVINLFLGNDTVRYTHAILPDLIFSIFASPSFCVNVAVNIAATYTHSTRTCPIVRCTKGIFGRR